MFIFTLPLDPHQGIAPGPHQGPYICKAGPWTPTLRFKTGLGRASAPSQFLGFMGLASMNCCIKSFSKRKKLNIEKQVRSILGKKNICVVLKQENLEFSVGRSFFQLYVIIQCVHCVYQIDAKLWQYNENNIIIAKCMERINTHITVSFSDAST